MRAYVCTIGEKTTGLCVSQLKRYGFEPVILGVQEPWYEKYKRFIMKANEDCIRIDADIIPNKNIIICDERSNAMMVQYQTFDLYKMDIGITSPVYYSKKALDIIKKNIDKIDKKRPETSAWRLPEIVSNTFTSNVIVGLHGFAPRQSDLDRAINNKKDRGQINDYDFELFNKLMKLK